MPLVQSVHFSNYRNFTDFTMDGLQRINLIVGDSNVGKTGLLEGLVTLWGNEEQFKALPNTFRMSYGDYTTSLDSFWSWLHPQRNHSLTMILRSTDIDNLMRAVRYEDHVRYDRDSVERSLQKTPYKINILPIGIGNYEFQVDLFNQLANTKNGKESLVSSLQVIEPRLKGLDYLKLPSSNHAMVYADVDLDYKIPTTQFGHGFTRSMEMLSNLILSGSDIMIADEIENGIHYSALGSVWKAIIDYAVKNDVQVFATTHSRECIAAAHEAMSEQENYELNVIRLQNRKGEVVAINHNKEDIETAFDLGLPLR
ncbi:AAA family ATPase [Leucothrix pacifica]|uniref:Uncharacterized protein n=1 Tax=Leucothrix pacifica TaxID=1247513 RepID=A0A317CEC7_9GAMM|nr:AAA family ATPase [Leucothrix pacifica]PWQ96886.1 hypothetical protein DKW60_11810 [Leucothrix pacifica]